MLNDFATLDAQDSISTLAQVTPEEQAEANGFFDDLNVALDETRPVTPAGEALNQRNWDMHREIHTELTVKMANLRMRDAIYEV